MGHRERLSPTLSRCRAVNLLYRFSERRSAQGDPARCIRSVIRFDDDRVVHPTHVDDVPHFCQSVTIRLSCGDGPRWADEHTCGGGACNLQDEARYCGRPTFDSEVNPLHEYQILAVLDNTREQFRQTIDFVMVSPRSIVRSLGTSDPPSMIQVWSACSINSVPPHSQQG